MPPGPMLAHTVLFTLGDNSPEHARFLEENEGTWKEIRVLDCYVER